MYANDWMGWDDPTPFNHMHLFVCTCRHTYMLCVSDDVYDDDEHSMYMLTYRHMSYFIKEMCGEMRDKRQREKPERERERERYGWMYMMMYMMMMMMSMKKKKKEEERRHQAV